jgi:hypothetical protein
VFGIHDAQMVHKFSRMASMAEATGEEGEESRDLGLHQMR